jgi:hypothetical protein
VSSIAPIVHATGGHCWASPAPLAAPFRSGRSRRRRAACGSSPLRSAGRTASACLRRIGRQAEDGKGCEMSHSRQRCVLQPRRRRQSAMLEIVWASSAWAGSARASGCRRGGARVRCAFGGALWQRPRDETRLARRCAACCRASTTPAAAAAAAAAHLALTPPALLVSVLCSLHLLLQVPRQCALLRPLSLAAALPCCRFCPRPATSCLCHALSPAALFMLSCA